MRTGKSTLLDLLAYRKTGGFITGEYYIGGQPEKPSSKWCSYVTQVTHVVHRRVC